MHHFPDSVGGSENGPRLPLGNGATFAPKVTCFTVYFLAGSHRLRATAPDMCDSSIVLALVCQILRKFASIAGSDASLLR